MSAQPKDGRLHYWLLLSHEEQVSAIRRMAGSRVSIDTIAGATGLSIEQIAAILREPPIPTTPIVCEGCE